MVLTLVAAGCDGGSEGDASPQPRAAPTASSSSSCANEAAVVGSDKTEQGTPRRADVDGDGTADEVRLHVDFDAPSGCQAFLVLEAGGGTFVEPVWSMGEAGGLPQPSLYSFSDIDRRRGYEIVVNEASGASTQFVAVYGFRSEDLVPIRVPDNENGLFAFGGSVGHIEAVDCTSEGDLVVSSAVPAAEKGAADKGLYQLRRTIYSFGARSLKRHETELHTIAIEDLEQFPEYRLGPFGTCAAP